MINFNINDFDPHKNYVIEANAGTGKTYNIILIVEKLLKEYDVDLNKILIVAYTEKAAGELKNRIRECINKDKSGKLKKYNPDMMNIFTIHSFCLSILKEYPLSSSLLSDRDLIDDNFLIDFASRYVRNKKFLDEYSLINKICDFDLDKIANLLVQAYKNYYLSYEYKEDKRVISLLPLDNYSLAVYDCITAASFDELYEKNDLVADIYDTFLNSEVNELNDFAHEIETKFNMLNKVNLFRKMCKTSEEKEAKQKFKILKEYFKIQTIYCCLIHKYLKDFYINIQIEKNKIKGATFNDLIRDVRENLIHNSPLLEKLKEKYLYGIIDEFQDTNQLQFDIFESIFLTDENHHIIVVGDPKQSIYGFQGADVHVYFKAVNKILNNGGIKCNLIKNYRSSEEMVKACNALFSNFNFEGNEFLASEFLSDNNDEDTNVALFDGKRFPALWFVSDINGKPLESDNDEDFAKIAINKIVECSTVTDNGKTRLQIKAKGSKEFRNVSFKDFTILVRVRNEMDPFSKELEKVGIPYVKYKDNSLFKTRECREWINIISAINTPDFTLKNRNKFYACLKSQFFGYTLEEINSDYFKRDNIIEIDLFNVWREMAHKGSYEDLFDNIVSSSRLINNLSSLSKLQSLAVFRQIEDYCISFLCSGHDLDELVSKLVSLNNGEASLDEEEENNSIVAKSTNFDAVQIMTMHASKGLDFPIVISQGSYFFKYQKKNVFTYNDSNDNKLLYVDFLNGENKLNDELESKLKLDSLNELKRLLYVAYTRSKYILMLPLYKNQKEAANKKIDHKNDIVKCLMNFYENNKNLYMNIYKTNFDYNLIKENVKNILISLNKKIGEIESPNEQEELINKLIKSSNKYFTYKHSYSSLSHGSFQIDEEDNKEGNINEGLACYDKLGYGFNSYFNKNLEPTSFTKNFPKGAKLGSALHEIFELLSFSSYTKEQLNYISRYSFANQGIEYLDEWDEYITSLVDNTLNAKLCVIHGGKLTNDIFNLSSLNSGDKKTEIEFNMNLKNEKLRNYCNGFIDLIFKNGEYYSILDWKSDTLSDDFISYNNFLDLKAHVDEAYSIQRTLYAYCLIKWLKQVYKNVSNEEIFKLHFGGVYYVFLRGTNKGSGNGIYAHTWDSYASLEKAFNDIISKKINEE